MANKKLNAVITIGGAVASSLKSAFGTVKGETTRLGSALRNLEGQQSQLAKSIQTFGRMGKNVDGMRERYAALTTQVDKLRGAYSRLAAVEKAQTANLERRAELRGQMLDTFALAATAAAPVVAAAQFETAMLGVAKQVDGARDDAGNLTAVYHDMAKSIQQLGREIPLATNELADMVAAGARMGVAKDQLIAFTKTTAMMAEAFELPAGELADNMGKIAGLFKIPIPAIGELADSINYLDDNAISKGGDIIDFLTRTGGAAASVKVTGAQMAALGSTLLTLGERTETAGTAVNAMFSKLAAADKGTKKFQAAVQEIGLSTAEIQKGMQTDSIGTLLKVMDEIGKLDPEKQLGVMVELVGLEHADTMAKLANNTGEFRRQLELVNSGKAKDSMSREFAARLQTTNAQWQLMKNRVHEVGVNLGTVLLPAINSVFSAISPVVSAMADFARENPKVTQAIAGTVVALTSLRVATLAGAYAFTFFKGAALQMVGIAAKMRAGFVLASSAMPAVVAGIRAVSLALVTNPIGAILAGIAFAGLQIYRHWDGVKAFMVGTFEGITAGLQPVVQVFQDFWKSLEPIHPAFEAIGGALQTAWQWFTDLVGPVSYSSEELKAAGEAGKSFGEMLAAGITFAMTPITALIEAITWINNNIGSALDKAVQFKNLVGDKVGGAWDATKQFFGGENKPAATAPAPNALAPALPTPAMATARGQGGSTYTDQSQTTIQVVQQPGENSRDLARRITEEQQRRRQVQQRGALYDGAVAQ